MRWVLAAITMVMLLFGAVVLAGGLLPREHQVARTAVIEASPAAVFGVIAGIEGMAAWHPDVYEVRRLADQAGRPVFREVGAHGPVTYAVTDTRPPARMVLRIEGAGPGFEGSWSFDLAPDQGRTRLTITERGAIANPVFRFVSRFVVGHATTIDAYLQALARHLGQRELRIE